VDSFIQPTRRAPIRGLIDAAGNAYLMREFPNLDYIKKAAVR
jgi:hypothetical protein